MHKTTNVNYLRNTTEGRLRLKIAREAQIAMLRDPIAHAERRKGGETCAQATAREAVEHADALIQALARHD